MTLDAGSPDGTFIDSDAALAGNLLVLRLGPSSEPIRDYDSGCGSSGSPLSLRMRRVRALDADDARRVLRETGEPDDPQPES